ncbi:hypothetical protein [Arthrobacter globiformis]|uniref:hypothetical protein n=1 Tax=Arthrobacter globiformis TaxID=1665 RepID=UPI00278F0ADF|nr:hypothetical protein [Arthrobacter globiformis]MDQ0617419.1 hypothetical protein [Arthrobacter globiformis]
MVEQLPLVEPVETAPLVEPAETKPADNVGPSLYNELSQAGAQALLLRSWRCEAALNGS